MKNQRTAVQQQVAEALIESKAINFEIVGSVISKFSESAALSGSDIAVIVGHRMWDICIPPFPYLQVHAGDIEQRLQA